VSARAAVVLFTRDLRVHDHPALAAAVREGEAVVPLFVLDDRILRSDLDRPNRLRFLRQALESLDASLRARGAQLVLRRGDPVEETARVAAQANAETVFASADVSGYAQARARRLARALDAEGRRLRLCPGVTVAGPDEILTSSGSHFSVFTPFYRRWLEAPRRAVEAAPSQLHRPADIDARWDVLADLRIGGTSPGLPLGGEAEARRRLERWSREALGHFGRRANDLAGDATSRLSPYLHLGCLSPLDLARHVEGREGGEPLLRQLAWRDFFHQLLEHLPSTAREDMRPRGYRWRDDPEALEAWTEGRTGIPIVDAGMRQLAREGWMHNRARLITASFLTKHLYLDWRAGARHFFDLLVDGDVANNIGNWQWVAGTGADTRPNRVLNPIRQARRFDPEGDYVRRYVTELADLTGPGIHEPWTLGCLRPSGYPDPIVDLATGALRFREMRGLPGPRRGRPRQSP
jgi:deoxyribodipyrimidine photo-lyase